MQRKNLLVNNTLLPEISQQPSFTAVSHKTTLSIPTRKCGFHFAKCKNKTPLDSLKGQSQSHHRGPFIPAPTTGFCQVRGDCTTQPRNWFLTSQRTRLRKTSPDLSKGPREERNCSLVQIRQSLQNVVSDSRMNLVNLKQFS